MILKTQSHNHIYKRPKVIEMTNILNYEDPINLDLNLDYKIQKDSNFFFYDYVNLKILYFELFFIDKHINI